VYSTGLALAQTKLDEVIALNARVASALDQVTDIGIRGTMSCLIILGSRVYDSFILMRVPGSSTM
jgi:hypothetical protein